MKSKFVLFIVCLCGIISTISAQQYAIDKKATIINGLVSFMSKGGDLFMDSDGNKSTSFIITPNFNHFITKNLFVGGGIDLSTESQGDYGYNGIGIGPQIGYAFGGPQSTAFPYLELGIRYYTMNVNYGLGDSYHYSGSDIALGFGVIVPIKPHLGLIIGGGYHIMDLKDKDSNDNYSGNILSIGIGIAGLLFKDLN